MPPLAYMLLPALILMRPMILMLAYKLTRAYMPPPALILMRSMILMLAYELTLAYIVPC
jgi:hypothetical protein